LKRKNSIKRKRKISGKEKGLSFERSVFLPK
jgi:hypothetical protein